MPMLALCVDASGTHRVEIATAPEGAGWVTIKAMRNLGQAATHDFVNLPVIHEGFYDSHLHPLWMAKLKNQINFKGRSIGELAETVRRDARSTLYGYGWDETELGKDLSEVAQLFDEKFVQSKKLYFFRTCSHLAYISQAAKVSLNLRSSLIADDHLQKIPVSQMAPADLRQNFLSVQSELRGQGISDWADLLVSAQDYSDQYLKSLSENQPQLFGDALELDFFSKLERKRVGYLKYFLDGSFGARTAWLSEPYSDAQETSGLQLWSNERLRAHVERALGQNFLLAFHVIGDRALDQLLWLGKELGSEFRRTGLMNEKSHRIEHVQLCRPDQLKQLSEQKFWTLGLQPSHRTFDQNFIAARLGFTRLARNAYRLRSFQDAGLRLTLGTDAPIVPANPEFTLKACLNDQRLNEKLTLAETYWLYCVEGRRNAGVPVKKLEVGSTARYSTPLT